MLLEKAIQQIAFSARFQTQVPRLDARVQLLTVLAYIIVVLSVPVADPAKLLWLFCFPIIMSEAAGIGYGSLLVRSLWVLPLVALVGAFNPILDHTVMWEIGNFTVTRGWMTFASLILRGLLAYQAMLLLIDSYGFYDICRCLQWMRCPAVLVTQLLMLYRYIGVLLRETLSMHRARQARGFGRKHYPLSMYGTFAGQLLLRSVQRARRVHQAMVARGFEGVYYFRPFAQRPKALDYAYLIGWIVVFLLIRFVTFHFPFL